MTTTPKKPAVKRTTPAAQYPGRKPQDRQPKQTTPEVRPADGHAYFDHAGRTYRSPIPVSDAMTFEVMEVGNGPLFPVMLLKTLYADDLHVMNMLRGMKVFSDEFADIANQVIADLEATAGANVGEFSGSEDSSESTDGPSSTSA